MRLTVSVVGLIGVALTAASLFLPWFVLEMYDHDYENDLTDFDMYMGFNSLHLSRVAYSTALYMMAVGLAVSVFSLLGGFVTLAGACTCVVGGVFGNEENYSFGTHELIGLTVSPGIGLYVAFAAAAAMILAMKYPVDVGMGEGGPRPKFRTWHLGRRADRPPVRDVA